MADILKFQTNVPQEIALAYESGREVEGNYGPQIMYTLRDGRVMYLPLLLKEKIAALRLSESEPFQICKAEVQNGQRKSIQWQVRRVYAAKAPAEGPTSAGASQQSSSETSSKESCATSDRNVQTINSVAFHSRGRVELRDSIVQQMEAAGKAAVTVVRSVEQHAAENSVSLRFTNEDVRAIWLSLFIQSSREGSHAA